jgi:hypothetical protein
MRCTFFPRPSLAALVVAAVLASPAAAGEGGWIDLSKDKDSLKAWDGLTAEWLTGGDAALDAKNPRLLTARPGTGVLVNGPKGRARNLVTKKQYTDVEVHVEFLIAKRSNSGVKLMGLYEIQILDSHGKKVLTGDDCGGIYPRAEDKPKYHHIDKGVPPRVNAAKPAGEWQTLDITFKAPRFDAAGRKTANARFVKVLLNGQVVHEEVEVTTPTGSAWRLAKEVPSGPLFLQADHGPVARQGSARRPALAASRPRPRGLPQRPPAAAGGRAREGQAVAGRAVSGPARSAAATPPPTSPHPCAA